jgi:hypothetical protein
MGELKKSELILFLVSGSFRESNTPENSEKIYILAFDITDALNKAKKYFEPNGGIIYDIESKPHKVLM